MENIFLLTREQAIEIQLQGIPNCKSTSINDFYLIYNNFIFQIDFHKILIYL